MSKIKKTALLLATFCWFGVHAQETTTNIAKSGALHQEENSPKADAERVRAVLKELVSRGIEKDTGAVGWFALSDTQLIVDGVAQPAALQKELQEKFAVEAGYGLYYGPVQVTGKGFFVDKQELASL